MAGGQLKTFRQLERHIKGVANHWRIQLLLTIKAHPDSRLDNLITLVDGNSKTIGEHVRRLERAGLVQKTYHDRYVMHRLTPYGERFCLFLESFQHS